MLPLKLRDWIVSHGPGLVRRPLSVTPFAVYRPLLAKVLDQLLAEPLAEGELDFLEGRWLKIDISDLGMEFCLSVSNEQMKLSSNIPDSDVIFSAQLNDLVLISARREDPDTLFFQRKLKIEGDTELGLEVKNLLAQLDMELLPGWLQKSSETAADWVESANRRQLIESDPA
ncbi:SCP2 domain-containing protein [Corallincola luteus]|uniref:Ubiquinone biosynthesis accessory factor UbiT n=1 Tax=Corallincola luteus TaxID=1775177 RepID=A0ABY2APY7_9GAMM|nr:SCP2 sterol-binding domain-containing protein [Corallincola luteus]TCI05255.1 SCP2 domain-containing protein [Corallincola luteus]